MPPSSASSKGAGDASYSSPLAERYASAAMLELWSARTRYGLWRQLWLALAEAQRELGVEIPDEALRQMRENLGEIDFDAVAAYERRFRHDVMAHIYAFGDVAPAAKAFIHLGATSAFVTDNADLVLMRRGLDLLRAKAVACLSALAAFARRWRAEPTLGYTHLQPAQLTTVGKRAALWMQDLLLDVADIDHRIATLPFRGVKGTTGTQASFLQLFEGDHARVRQLDELVTRKMGFPSSLPVTGQTYSRKLDAQVLGVVSGLATSAAKFSGDIRMLQAFGEIEEPFEAEQIGSSAMAYKRNPMRCERATGLARFVISLSTSPLQTAAEQWFERTLDDSSNKRLAVPEPFLAVDACLNIVINVARGLVVYPKSIEAAVRTELPFMATEEILMAAVTAGGDRQELHEVIRAHSHEAALQVKQHGRPNDLIERLKQDRAFAAVHWDKVMAPPAFVGRAPQQVEAFVRDVAGPVRQRYAEQLGQGVELIV